MSFKTIFIIIKGKGTFFLLFYNYILIHWAFMEYKHKDFILQSGHPTFSGQMTNCQYLPYSHAMVDARSSCVLITAVNHRQLRCANSPKSKVNIFGLKNAVSDGS